MSPADPVPQDLTDRPGQPLIERPKALDGARDPTQCVFTRSARFSENLVGADPVFHDYDHTNAYIAAMMDGGRGLDAATSEPAAPIAVALPIKRNDTTPRSGHNTHEGRADTETTMSRHRLLPVSSLPPRPLINPRRARPGDHPRLGRTSRDRNPVRLADLAKPGQRLQQRGRLKRLG